MGTYRASSAPGPVGGETLGPQLKVELKTGDRTSSIAKLRNAITLGDQDAAGFAAVGGYCLARVLRLTRALLGVTSRAT